MLTIADTRPTHDCQGFSRRDFLRIGVGGLGGLSLANLLETQARASGSASVRTGKSVVLLFLQGGPPHIEFFDPKTTAPAEIRSVTGEVQTSLPGITFGGTFPKLAALANRLVVVRSYGSGNSPKNMAGIWAMGGQVDHAVSAFIDDVRERGLEDKILLAVTGEMGRTPRLNRDGGRDHYGELTPLLLFGGGWKMGQVIGQSDGQAARASTEPYRPEHLISTVMHTLFDVGLLRLEPDLPREVIRLTELAKPIDHLA